MPLVESWYLGKKASMTSRSGEIVSQTKNLEPEMFSGCRVTWPTSPRSRRSWKDMEQSTCFVSMQISLTTWAIWPWGLEELEEPQMGNLEGNPRATHLTISARAELNRVLTTSFCYEQEVLDTVWLYKQVDATLCSFSPERAIKDISFGREQKQFRTIKEHCK
jgi:hypothetical protein